MDHPPPDGLPPGEGPSADSERAWKGADARGLGAGQVAEVFAEYADPVEGSIAQIADEVGLTRGAAKQLIAGLRRRGLLLERALGEVSKAETRQLYEHLSWRILKSVSQRDIDRASLNQKILSAAIATDKALLLSGQPTEILSVKELGRLDELMEMLLMEAKRRGLEPRRDEATQSMTVEASALGQADPRDKRNPQYGLRGPSEEPR